MTAVPLRPRTAEEDRWLVCLSRMAAAGKKAAGPLYGTAKGRVSLGRGAGGDHTLEIDRACEAAIREVLNAEAPGAHQLVSEEAGVVGAEDAQWRVVVDPLDGSLNAKHGLEPFGVSLAVATGGTLGDVTVGYIEDYTRPHVFAAVKGAGPLVWEQRWKSALRAERTERFDSDLIEILLLEASRPDRHDFRYSQLSSIAPKECAGEMRVRQIGSLALSLCYLAVGAADVLVGAVQTRSVDVAAGFLILEEAGGGVVALDDADIWQRPLDLQKRGGFMAWRRGLDSAQIMGKARQLRDSLLVRP